MRIRGACTAWRRLCVDCCDSTAIGDCKQYFPRWAEGEISTPKIAKYCHWGLTYPQNVANASAPSDLSRCTIEIGQLTRKSLISLRCPVVLRNSATQPQAAQIKHLPLLRPSFPQSYPQDALRSEDRQLGGEKHCHARND
jgi:hypothetical protein